MVNWLALALPFVYLGVLVGSLATFSTLYRKRKACTQPQHPLTHSQILPNGIGAN